MVRVQTICLDMSYIGVLCKLKDNYVSLYSYCKLSYHAIK